MKSLTIETNEIDMLNSTAEIKGQEHSISASSLVEKSSERDKIRWFALRDLTRTHSKNPGYKILPEKGIEVFTPMSWKIVIKNGKRKRIETPVLMDLLFAHSSRAQLDEIIENIPTIQYRYARGAYCQPIIISDVEMEQFIRATTGATNPTFYSPEEVSKLSIGSLVHINGGPLDGVEGKIIKVRGAKKKRILVSIPEFISAVVEIEPENLTILE